MAVEVNNAGDYAGYRRKMSGIDGDGDDSAEISADAVAVLLNTFRDTADKRIKKRISEGDILRVYPAKITERSTVRETIGTVNINDTEVDVTRDVLSYIRVKYNDSDYAEIANSSLRNIPTDALWCMIGRTDDLSYYALWEI